MDVPAHRGTSIPHEARVRSYPMRGACGRIRVHLDEKPRPEPHAFPEHERLQDTILEQDRPIVESQRPWLLPPEFTHELYVRPADQPLVAFQKWLAELHIPQEV